MTTNPVSSPRQQRPRLPARTGPVVFAFYMAAIMAFLMCTVLVAASNAMDSQMPAKVLRAYSLAMPCAFVSVLAVRPVVVWLVRCTVREE